jgi:hypothetical protein
MLSSALLLSQLLSLQVEVQSWTRVCKEKSPNAPLSCGIPVAFKNPSRAEILVEVAEKVGDARVTKMTFGEGDLAGEIRFYSAYPEESSGRPPFIQIQIETISPVRSLCLQTVRLRRPFEASPLSCAGWDAASGRQVGVNAKLFEPVVSPATSSSR